MTLSLLLVILLGAASIAYGVVTGRQVLALDAGSARMQEIAKAIEEGVNHLWTLSALQLHPWALIVVDEDATAG